MSAPTPGTRSRFLGQQEHLDRFLRLVASPVRSQARGLELQAWSEFKKSVCHAHVVAARREARGHSVWTKIDDARCLAVPAIDLRGAVIRGICLGYVDLRGARLDRAAFLPDTTMGSRPWVALKGAKLNCASLRHSSLRGVRLMGADLSGADLTGADLRQADLSGANLRGANLAGARLDGANLECANVMEADLRGTRLSGARVYGLTSWDAKVGDDAGHLNDLIVTPRHLPPLTVNNLDVAQFLYVLMTGTRLGPAFDALGQKGVLVLGRFTAERKKVLDSLREGLRQQGFVPLIFDFDRPHQRDLTEMVRLLAGISRFIIADITNPRSSPLELQATVPEYMVPLAPVIERGQKPFAMFKDLWVRHSHWVMDPLEYESGEQLAAVLRAAIVEPALKRSAHIARAKARKLTTRSAAQFLARSPDG